MSDFTIFQSPPSHGPAGSRPGATPPAARAMRTSTHRSALPRATMPSCSTAIPAVLPRLLSRHWGSPWPICSQATQDRMVTVHRGGGGSTPSATCSGQTWPSTCGPILRTAQGLWALIRERGRADAVLHVTGRDIEEREFALSWDPTLATWALEGPAAEYRLSVERQQIADLVKNTAEPMPPKEIAERLHKNHSTTKVLLRKMVDAGEIAQVTDGRYTPVNPVSRVNPMPESSPERFTASMGVNPEAIQNPASPLGNGDEPFLDLAECIGCGRVPPRRGEELCEE